MSPNRDLTKTEPANLKGSVDHGHHLVVIHVASGALQFDPEAGHVVVVSTGIELRPNR
jgi:hypothetical protein